MVEPDVLHRVKMTHNFASDHVTNGRGHHLIYSSGTVEWLTSLLIDTHQELERVSRHLSDERLENKNLKRELEGHTTREKHDKAMEELTRDVKP